MAPLFRIVLCLVLLSKSVYANQATGKGHKPEVGKEDCRWWYGGATSAQGVWGNVWKATCWFDDQGRPIHDDRGSFSNRTNLDPCCTEYIGLVCRHVYWDKKEGRCAKPDPYQQDRKIGAPEWLSLMKKKKLDDGQHLDHMWENVRIRSD